MPLKLQAVVTDVGLNKKIKDLKDGKFLQKAAVILEQIMVDQSPVDTGLLRANWQIGTGAIPSSPLKRKEHIPSKPPKPKNNSITVYNNIRYILQANIRARRVPPRFIERSISLFIKELSKLINKGFFDAR